MFENRFYKAIFKHACSIYVMKSFWVACLDEGIYIVVDEEIAGSIADRPVFKLRRYMQKKGHQSPTKRRLEHARGMSSAARSALRRRGI